jgi:hypothetical protein
MWIGLQETQAARAFLENKVNDIILELGNVDFKHESNKMYLNAELDNMKQPLTNELLNLREEN